jgi:hypothetical protein
VKLFGHPIAARERPSGDISQQLTSIIRNDRILLLDGAIGVQDRLIEDEAPIRALAAVEGGPRNTDATRPENVCYRERRTYNPLVGFGLLLALRVVSLRRNTSAAIGGRADLTAQPAACL